MDKFGPKQPEQRHESKGAAYIPAFSHGFLTPLYDFMMKWTARESAFKPRLVEQARIEKGHRVLDIGCGTATLTILIKKTQPEAEVIGLDADPKILEIARSKVAKADLDIALDYGTASELPYVTTMRRILSLTLTPSSPRTLRAMGNIFRCSS